MAGHGRGSINLQLDKLRTAGHHEHLTLRVVEKLKDQLHDAAENLHPNKIRKYQKALKEMDGDLQVVQQALHKSGEQWRRAARVDFAVRQSVRAELTTELTPQLLSEKLQQYVHGESSSAAGLPVQDLTGRDAASSIRGGRLVRLRTFDVDGHQILEPANGVWYQTSEAVRILYDLKQTGKRLLSKVIARWHQHVPRQIGMTASALMDKVKCVETAVENGFSVEEALDRLITDRVAIDEKPAGGRPPVMRQEEFVRALKKHCRHDKAASKETAAAILSEAKTKHYKMKGLRPSSSNVCLRTVHTWWQTVGGADLPIRGKVQERAFARVQAARSFMHMMSYFFTVFYTHVFPAPVGKGKMPPTENWAAGLVEDFYGVPVMPVHRACVLNSDSSTFAITVHGDRRAAPDVHVVLKEDHDAGKMRAFWSAGASAKTQVMYVETFDVISGDFHCGDFVWVSSIPR